MLPFLLLASRAEDAAAEDEYAAYLRYGGLEERELRRVRLEAAPLPALDLSQFSGVIVGGNGCYLPGTFFAHFFKEYTFLLRQYQIVQHKPGTIMLKLVKGHRFSDQHLADMLAALRQYVGASTEIAVEFVDVVPLGRTGKRQAVISSVPLDYQDISIDRAQSAG